jgi:hypothetical protein
VKASIGTRSRNRKTYITSLFKRIIYVLFSTPEYAAKFAKKIAPNYIFDYISYDACVETLTNGDCQQYLLFIDSKWKDNSEGLSLLAHEMFHLSYRIQENITSQSNFSITNEIQEHTAYLIENVFLRVLNIIRKELGKK